MEIVTYLKSKMPRIADLFSPLVDFHETFLRDNLSSLINHCFTVLLSTGE